jgi:hypothetical protein
MIANRSSGITVEGNITGQSFQAGIDDENMGWVISLFTDLYSDPQRAVIREYPTNARDAMIEAGVDGPIEITLPTALAPFWKVKDRGVGLSAEDIQRMYSRYGSSTKRGTNDQNGMLGMGCKSALAYCEQFTVESVKDGMRTVCSITREEGGVPVFTVVASIPDDEAENGTEVIVPVQRHHINDFANKAAEFFKYWPEGTVLVNGEQPERIEGLDLGDGLLLCKKDGYSYGRNPNIVVMGNVPYPVEEGELDLGLPNNYWLVATVDIGSVEFAPSREALLYNKVTRSTLTAISPRVQKAVAKAVQAEVDKADSFRGAIRVMMKWRDLYGSSLNPNDLTYQSKNMPALIDGACTVVPWRGHKQTAHETRDKGVQTEIIAEALVVEGYTNASFTATMKKKLLQYCEENSTTVSYFVLYADKAPDTEWIVDEQIVPWDDIKAVKLSTTAATYGWRSGRPTGSYDAYIGGVSQHIQADEIDQNEPIYYCRSMNKYEGSRYAEIIGKEFPDATVVCLPENRYAKFQRNFPTAENYRVGVQAAYDKWSTSITKGQRLALAIDSESDYDAFRTLKADAILDPDIKKACLIAQNVDVEAVKRAERRFANVRHCINTNEIDGEPWTCPLEKYPLLSYMHYRTPWSFPDTTLYLNAAYLMQSAGDLS